MLSRPTWARGLKLANTLFNSVSIVASHVGAWIETEAMEVEEKPAASRPTWARGLKHQIALMLLTSD